MFTSEVQFGHAGACANAERETADAKNKALLAAGAHVPDSFDTLGTIIGWGIVWRHPKVFGSLEHDYTFL